MTFVRTGKNKKYRLLNVEKRAVFSFERNKNNQLVRDRQGNQETYTD